MAETKRIKRKYSVRKLRNLIWIALCSIILIGGAASFMSLQGRVDELQDQKDKLTAQREEVRIEVERMQRLLEFSKMDDYSIALAHDKLGLLKPDEIKFVEPSQDAEGP